MDFGALFGFLEQLLGEIAQLIVAVFEFLWKVIVDVFNFLFGGLVNTATFMLHGDALGLKIWHGLHEILAKLGILKLFEWLKSLYERLQKILGPVICFLKTVRKWYDIFFNRYVRPLLNLIQHVRQVLAIFKIFHLKWAEELDNRLGRIEARIVKDVSFIKQKINFILNYLELLTDINGLIRRVPLLNSLARALGGVRKLLLGFDPNLVGHDNNAGDGPQSVGNTWEMYLTDYNDAAHGNANYLTAATDAASDLYLSFDVPPDDDLSFG